MRRMERPADGQQRHGHPDDSNSQQGLAPQTIDQPDGHECHADVHEAHEHRLREGCREFTAGRGEDGRQIIEYGVDAGGLLNEGNAKTEYHDPLEPPGQQFADANVARFLDEVRLDDLELATSVVWAVKHGERGPRAGRAALAQQPSRAFGHQGQQQEVESGGYGLNAQHPSPASRAQRQQKVIGKKRDRDADDDHQLVEGDQTSAAARRRHFRDVHRGYEDCGAHSKTTAYSCRDEHRKASGKRRRQRGGEK